MVGKVYTCRIQNKLISIAKKIIPKDFWPRLYTVVLKIAFFFRSQLFSHILFGLLFPFSIWTFISLFYLDFISLFYLDFYFSFYSFFSLFYLEFIFIFYLDFYFPFLFGLFPPFLFRLLFPFSIWIFFQPFFNSSLILFSTNFSNLYLD